MLYPSVLHYSGENIMALAYSTSTNSSSASPVLNRVLTSFGEVNLKHEQTNRLESENYAGELAFLRQQNKQLQHVIDVMPTGMIMLNGNGIVVKINDTARLLLDEPILGQPWFDVIKRSFKPRADDWHEVSLNDGRRVKLEITALGDQPGQLIMITDLTETRLLQDKLGQLQRLSSLGRMVSKLAHQIRTPLSAAMLYGANLRNKKLTNDARVNFQDKLMLRLHDLEQQVNDMLLFAKSGKQAVVEPLNINQLIEGAKQAIEPQVNQVGAKVNLHFCSQGCEVLGNATALSGAIQNLINNSLSVIKTAAVIDISAYCHDDYAYISVRDNGPGISADLADKIFEPFYTSRSQGTGLGLAVVKSVTNAHQGEVSLLSKPGEGAHFCMKIPKLTSNQTDVESNHKDKEQALSKELTNDHK
ncbi:sensor histidine kinase [Cognaticolwellia aestuarii]|jgi:two-component system sensor histidine kinase FlrB|uniref:sensor histidine kinase n=1 Tax=Cognaticolwellia aestuarii TaxID=329993 RepID=UPI000B0AEB74|nr:ATP-binding protein [Cognaticolwellia aestuarii]|tara:strand:+ start:864 stop:2114 length:1251 start_codon:yes stop_codon:yes gene_type:complete